MRRYSFLALIFAFVLLLTGCGGGPGGGGGADVTETPPAQSNEGRSFAFLANPDDPTRSILPTPSLYSQILISNPSSTTRAEEAAGFPSIYLSGATDPETAALYALVNAAQLRGLSPNMFISVPSYYPVNATTLTGRYVLIDLTCAQLAKLGNETCASLIDQTGRLEAKVYNYLDAEAAKGILRFYPVKPLEPGHIYVLFLLKGIKTLDGGELSKLNHIFYQYLEASDEEASALQDKLLSQFTGEARQNLEANLALLDQLRVGINRLEASFGRDNIILAVPFQTASKTFSANAFALMQQCLAMGGNDTDAISNCIYENFNSTADLVSYNEDLNNSGFKDVVDEAVGIAEAAKIITVSYYYYLQGIDNNTAFGKFCSSFVENSTIKSFDITKLDVNTLVTKFKTAEYLLDNYNDTSGFIDLHQYVANLVENGTRILVPYVVYPNINTSGVWMYQHGLGQSKDTAWNAAEALDSQGLLPYPVIGIDLPCTVIESIRILVVFVISLVHAS